MSKVKIFSVGIVVAILAACNSVESELRSFMKCGMAANSKEFLHLKRFLLKWSSI